MTPFPSHPRRPLTRRIAALATVAGVIAAALPSAHAQAQPQLDSPLRIVVGYAPGGATDRVARIVGDKLATRLGVPVVVDNKPGAGGRLAAQQVKIPTFKEAGLDLSATGWNTFFAPASMPKDKVERLASAIHAVMQDPDTTRRFKDSLMTPVVSTQAQTVAMLKAYRAQWAPVVQKSGYQP